MFTALQTTLGFIRVSTNQRRKVRLRVTVVTTSARVHSSSVAETILSQIHTNTQVDMKQRRQKDKASFDSCHNGQRTRTYKSKQIEYVLSSDW